VLAFLTLSEGAAHSASVVVANHHKLSDTSYRVKFPGVAEITEEHPPKRQQQAAAAKAPEITPFTS
jgi:hypothetical protein